MESPLILNPDKITVLVFHCDSIQPLQTLSIPLISQVILAVMTTLAFSLVECQPWQKTSWKSYVKSDLSFLIKEKVLVMVSCLKANICNSILDSCNFMQSWLESKSFVLCPGFLPHTPDTQLITNCVIHHHLSTRPTTISTFFQHHSKICHISMPEYIQSRAVM